MANGLWAEMILQVIRTCEAGEGRKEVEMTAKDAIRHTLDFCRHVLLQYVEDMSDADLLVRPVPSANHVAWQMGHLIVTERDILAALGRLTPPLPSGFEQAHGSENARSDDRSRFYTKKEYLDLMKKLRDATLLALDALPATDLDRPAPESMRSYAPTIGAALILLGTHELMHAGQFVTVRRKLGKPILF